MKTLRDRGLSSAPPSSRSRRSSRAKRPVEAAAEAASGMNVAAGALNRMVQANSTALSFLGLTLGVFVTRKFLMLPVAVALCIAQEMGKDHLKDKMRLLKPRRR